MKATLPLWTRKLTLWSLLSSATAADHDDDDDDDDDTIEFGVTDDIKAITLAAVGCSLTQAALKVRRPGCLLMCI